MSRRIALELLRMESNLLTNTYVVALGVPIILLFCGAFGKKIVRGNKWKRHDFFLGVQIMLGAITTSLIRLVDIAGQPVNQAVSIDNTPFRNSITATTVYLALAFVLFLVVVSTHQDWEKKNSDPNGQIIVLVVTTNLLGILMIAAYIFLVKGI